MVSRRSRGFGRYASGEADMVITAPSYDPSVGGPLVIVCHGAGASPASYSAPANRRDLDLLARTGCVVVAAELGGQQTWGNDTFLDRLDDVRTWAEAEWGADLDRTALIGDSMGAMGALGWGWRNPDLWQAAVLRVPVVAADALHDRDPDGLGALIDSAYGGTAGWEAAVPDRDPLASANAAAIAAVAERVQVLWSTDDPVVLPADVTAYVAATGVRAIPLGAVQHDEATVYPAIHTEQQAQFIWSHF